METPRADSVDTPDSGTPTRPLYRCFAASSLRANETGSHAVGWAARRGAVTGHFFSTDAQCEGGGSSGVLLGHVAVRRGGEMLRALRRCRSWSPGRLTHALDLHCDVPDGNGLPLGFVR
jgi:hypothetical protein